MNPVPLQTGTLIFHFSRTFRHYICTGVPNYTKTFDQQWSDIPYQFINASCKPRDWQILCVTGKRFRVISVGFNMMHIIPMINQTNSVGAAVKAEIAFNLMPYLETYIDKGYQLPIGIFYTSAEDLPNKGLTHNSTNQTQGALKLIDIEQTAGYKPIDTSNPTLNLYNKEFPWAFDLMNSKEWGTCLPTQEFSFEWKPNAEDLVWRSGLTPSRPGGNMTNLNWLPADPTGRWDGDISNMSSFSATSSNIHGLNQLKRNPTKPMPSCLIRPATFHDAQTNLLPLVFQCLVKYHSTIEVDVNDLAYTPIFNSAFDVIEPARNSDFWNIYRTSARPGQDAYTQWSGANAAGNFVSGPSAGGHVV